MLHLRVLSESMAGSEMVARHFPFRIGRSEAASLRLKLAGIWEEHAEFNLANGWVTITSCDQAPVRMNGGRLKGTAVVHCGDLIDLGSLRFIAELSAADRRKDLLQQVVLAVSILGLTLTQLSIFWWLSNQ
jgi:hypothetical protein